MTYKGMGEDLRFISRSAEELDLYLSSEVLLWRMQGLEISLSPGNLLLAMRRSGALLNDELKQEFSDIENLIETRTVVWEKKIDKELPMRINQWRDYVRDLQRYGVLDASYIYNIRVRVILDLLFHRTRAKYQTAQEQVNQSDEVLYRMANPGEFAWDDTLRAAFPRDVFPYLYLKQAGK